MGNLHAAVIAEAVETGDVNIDVALRWHLGSNHFPAIPADFDASAKRAIEIGAGLVPEWSEDPARFESEIELPNGRTVTVRQYLDQCRLWYFVECLADSPIDEEG